MTADTSPSHWPHLFVPGDGPVILALHGTGGSESDGVALAGALWPGAAVLAPRGAVLEQGMSRWFRRLEEGVFDVDDVIRQASALGTFVTETLGQRELGGRPVIATGFSNGANMALALAVLHPGIVQTVVAFSGMYPLAERELPQPLPDSRILLLNGETDQMAPQRSVDRLDAQLAARGAAVTRVTRPGGHGITPDEIEQAHDWIAALA